MKSPVNNPLRTAQGELVALLYYRLLKKGTRNGRGIKKVSKKPAKAGNFYKTPT